MNRIKELRQKNKLSQIELANKVNASNQAISAYESGTREPKKPMWQALADFFNVSVAYLKGAYSKEEIAKIVQDEYKKQYDLKDEKGFHFIMSKLPLFTVDNYFISIGIVPFDIKQEEYLLTDKQVNDFEFWLNNLESIYNMTLIKWLLEKPSLNASKEDVLKAVESAMNNIINQSSIEILNPWLESKNDLNDHHYYSKRLEFLNSHLFYDEEVMDDGHTELIPYIDFNKTNHNN